MFLDKNLPLSATSQTDDDGNSDEDEDKRTIFCANLHERVTEEILCELFIQGGPIQSVRIPTDKDGRSRNFGFITYIHSCSVRYALQLFDGVRLFNRQITMRFNGNNSNNNYNNNNSNHHQQQHFYEQLRFSRIPPQAPKFHIESTSSMSRSHKNNDKKTSNKLPFENNSSALRLGGSSSSSHIRFDSNMQPKEKSRNEKSKNPFKIDLSVLSRLSSNLLPPKESQKQSNKNHLSGNNTNNRNDKNLNSKDRHRSHGNRERDNLHPYKRPDIHTDIKKGFGRNHTSSNERNGRNRGNNRRR